jgi:hypothetical protein
LIKILNTLSKIIFSPKNKKQKNKNPKIQKIKIIKKLLKEK